MSINILSIAGSDSGGGAGIQADLKTFSALGAYGMSVITAVTAQNTQGVQGVYPVAPDAIAQQIDSVMSDIRIDAIKIGMLGDLAPVQVVVDALKKWQPAYVVLDPVMVAKGGQALVSHDAIRCIRDHLLPHVNLITPNLPEAAVLLGQAEAQNEQQMRQQGHQLVALGVPAVLIKGGHLAEQESPDWLITATEEHRLSLPRVATHNTHGTGCTLSAAIAALYPTHGLVEATRLAKQYLHNALIHADRLTIGQGIGPTHHFHAYW